MKLECVVASPVEAHSVVNNLFQHHIKPHTRTGAQGVITWQTMSAYLHEKHRAAFHGPILKAFSEQVWFIDGETGRRFRWSKAAWKQWLKEEFCPQKFEEYTDRTTGEVKTRVLPLSTESLSDDEYQEFLMAVQACGMLDFNIEFEEEGY
ncbi:MAG: hypothetical protein JWQ03_1629 [Variovorax sp.]|nr:hypothetical protein [Variovorax sp.]